jgi:error-prone DNA polymerase
MAAVRARRSLAEIAGWLPLSGAAHLRSGDEMARIFARYPGAVARSVTLADELAFDLRKAKPELPMWTVPPGKTPMEYLRGLVEKGFDERYGHEPEELRERARVRIDHELRVIEQKKFAGYFVIVHDIVAYARGKKILCQGRGSAASSAVCYALGVTAIDPVFYELPFERFISHFREEEPDIDVDFDSDRREEVIQWVYKEYGRGNAAQVANVISYRPRSAVRDAAKALGYSPGQQDAWSKRIHHWASVDEATADEAEIPPHVAELANQLMRTPRHLSIHSGGMILTERPIGEVVPIERARKEKRTVLQWDKDACEYMGLVKFDLLGLGMLGALDHMLRLIAEHTAEEWELATIPREEPAVYDMLCRADAIGVFQVESRAQIGTLPRLRPRCFYDLAIEIALIRPGPIQGGAVHPYVRRATGKDPIVYAHDLLVPVLERTKGVPLFQEQLMEMGRVLGDFTVDDGDLLRRAMGSKRGVERIEKLKEKLFTGMLDKGMSEEDAKGVYVQILSFAHFGFAESHALSFAKLVYASSWFKLHYPAAFLAGLLRAQPMGFYSAQSLVGDARRHGVGVLRPDLRRSGVDADLERIVSGPPGGSAGCLRDHGSEPTTWVPSTPDPTPAHRRDGPFGVRLGLASVRGVGPDVAARIVRAREEAPFADIPDLSRRAALDSRHLEALATAGAFEDAFTASRSGKAMSRREALWQSGWTSSSAHLDGLRLDVEAPPLPAMDEIEETLADLWATGVTPEGHPFRHLREQMRSAGVLSIADLAEVQSGRWVTVAGLVTHRQRPSTAGGVTFLNLEDETGMLNVVCGADLWKRHSKLAFSAAGLLVRGRLEHSPDAPPGLTGQGATNLLADRFGSLAMLNPAADRALRERHRSRDFH